MTYYHNTEAEAKASVAHLEQYWETYAQLEPYNGWVAVLVPKSNDVYNWPLAPLIEIAELQLGTARHRPSSYKRPPSMAQVKAKNAPPPPPPPPVAGVQPAPAVLPPKPPPPPPTG